MMQVISGLSPARSYAQVALLFFFFLFLPIMILSSPIPGSASWSPTGALATARAYHTATLLLNGKVLVAGGCELPYNFLGSAEFYQIPVVPPCLLLSE